jgi:hypothetical protein
VNKLSPSVEHLGLQIILLIEVLQSPYRLEYEMLLSVGMMIESLSEILIIIPLLLHQFFNISQLRLVVEILLPHRALLIELFA